MHSDCRRYAKRPKDNYNVIWSKTWGANDDRAFRLFYEEGFPVGILKTREVMILLIGYYIAIE